ncbi:Chondroitin sulfate proteoglycan 4-like protein [Dinothrombium tinctorium]|uniref:Chondroitin sulfate proteoglycan 4-like protein n=1 Tax=Dinothrombium tinctorium TaxID=1965070 RepID=A0A3S4RB53_9ACAR|nr:Chondroitin sulfate proteoglycan 4-like protein [Dinothrombium tinctorium]
MEDARSTTKISFRLKTHRTDGMLFLAAGPIDYCLILLENGALKLRINLGSGETVLTSKSGLKLNDLVWHQVNIERTQGELSMTIDGLHTTYAEIQGNFFELNIKYGLYIGGLGDFNEIFLGNLRNFRGCIDQLQFNEIDVFAAVSKSADGVIESVTFDCSAEFDSLPSDAISFVETGAFIILPGFAASRSGASLHFAIVTSSEIAILFYSSGSPTQLADFIAVEIINGRISLSANDGNGVVVLQSDVIVNDGQWHEVELRFSPSYLEITVDGKSRNLRPSLGDKKFFDLSNDLYVGGLELNKQSIAFQQGLQSVLSEGTEISMRGCLKAIKINDDLIGVRDAEVSKGLKTGEVCMWQFPCLTDAPCVESAECYQEGFTGFRCLCASGTCMRPNYTLQSKIDNSGKQKTSDKSNTTSKIITLTTGNITVTEGQSSLILGTDLSAANSYYDSWISEYLIVEEPKYGWIRLTNSWDKAVTRFTPIDLKIGLVIYEHDGSETTRDWFTIVARSEKLREESAPATIHVSIEPINDEMPRIVNNTGLQLWESTRVTLTNSNLAAVDDDSSTSEIVYQILTQSNGYFSLANDTENAVITFTQKQIDDGAVMYTHEGQLAGGFRFKVGDGVNYDSSHIFTVNAKALNITLKVNEVLHVMPNMQQSITKDHLFAVTNDGNASRTITFEIVKEPEFGQILIENSDGSTSRVNKFTQRQLNRKLVLYEHNSSIKDGSSLQDLVVFDIKSANIQPLRNVKFHIEVAINTLIHNFVQQAVDLLKSTAIVVEEGKKALITEKQLNTSLIIKLWTTHKLTVLSDRLFIRLESNPKHGFLLFDNRNLSLIHSSVKQKSRITELPLSAFSDGSFVYQHDDSNTFNDTFTVGIYVKNGGNNVDTDGIHLMNQMIRVEVIGTNDERPTLITKEPIIEVIQGAKVLIDRNILYSEDEDRLPNLIKYRVIETPQNGYFMLEESEAPIENFTQWHILNNKVYFKSDNTRKTSHFQIEMTDGHFKPLYALATVRVKPVTLYLVNRTDVELVQGSTAIKLSSRNLGSQSNDNDAKRIIYRLVRLPVFGKLLVNDEENVRFTQRDITLGFVVYVQTNMSFSGDLMMFDITNSEENVINNVTIHVNVLPLINAPKTQYLTVGLHQKAQITTDHLDATPLAKQSKSNPRYLVRNKARFGYLRKFADKKVGKNRDKRVTTKEATEFTHEDVVKARLAFVIKSDVKLKSSSDYLTDEITFELMAANAQPAKVILKIKIVKTLPSSSSNAEPTMTSDQSTNRADEIESEMIRPNVNYLSIIITRDHFLVIALVSFVLLAVIIILILVRIVSRGSSSHSSCDKQSQKRSFEADSPPNSEFDRESMLMSGNRHVSMQDMTPSISEMETCIRVPQTSPSISTTCGSDHHSRSVTPMKPYPVPTINSHRLRPTASGDEDSSHETRAENVFPLPPPSLYFGTESASDSTTPSSQWCTFHPNTLPSTKLSPTLSNFSHEVCAHNCHHIPSTIDPSTVRMLGDGTSNVGTPLPSLRKVPWSSEDVNSSPSVTSYAERNRVEERCHNCQSPTRCHVSTPKTFYVNGSEMSRMHSLTTPTTPMLRRRQHYWV